MVVEGIAGAILRIVPEFFKSWNKKKELDHEHRMLEAEMEFAKLRGEQDMRQAEVQLQGSELDAISVAHQEQTKLSKASGKFVSAISALVRPTVTYWFVFLYSVVKLCTLYVTLDAGIPIEEAIPLHWNREDASIMTMILTFWFCGRVFERDKDHK